MSQININSLTAFLNTSFKTLLVVTTICLSAVVANAANFAPNDEQDKIFPRATVIVTGKSYTHNLTLGSTTKVDMTKLVSFKTPKNMAGLDTDCTIKISFVEQPAAINSATINFTLPKGWKNTAEENNAIKADIAFKGSSSANTIKYVANSGNDAIEAKWLNGTNTSDDNAFTEFVAGKTVKVDGKNQVTTGAVITVKISLDIKPIANSFTATNSSVIVKDITKDSNNVTGEFKLSFKNDASFQGIDTAVLTASTSGMKLFNDKNLDTLFVSDTFLRNAKFYPNFEKTLYFKVDSTVIGTMTNVGLTKDVTFTVTEKKDQDPKTKTVTSNVTITTKKTNFATLKLSKTELKDIKVKTDIIGTIEFTKALDSDLIYTVDSKNNTVTGVTFEKKEITISQGAKKATFKVTFEPNTTATNSFVISATAAQDSAIAANLFNSVLEKDVNVSIFEEVNGFVIAKKGVTVTLKNNLLVKIPFKFKKPVKETVEVKISVNNNKIEGTNFVDTTITVDTKKNSFFVEVKITDIAKFNGLGSVNELTATVVKNYPASGLKKDMSTKNSFVTTDLVSKFITADFSWLVDDKKPTDAQKNATSALAVDSKIKLIITVGSNLKGVNDTSLKTLVKNALSSNAKIPFLVKLDKNAEMAFEVKSFEADVELDKGMIDSVENHYCASKKIKATATVSTKAKGIKMLNKKITFLLGDELDLDPFAAPVADYSSNKFTLVSKNAYTSVPTPGSNFEISSDKLVFNANVTTPEVYDDVVKTAKQSAKIKMYVGTGVAKDEIYTAAKSDFLSANADTSMITVAPALSFYVCDPITNPNELKPAKKIALKTAKGKDFDKASKNIDYTIPSAPIVYNKKELANYRKDGKFFSALNPLTDTMIQPKQGFVGATVKMAWKQGKKNEAGYIDAKESEDISVVVFAPATITAITADSLMSGSTPANAFALNVTGDSMILTGADTVTIAGKFLTAKTTLSAEYLDGSTVKVVSFKFGKDDVKFDAAKGEIIYNINPTTAKAFAKLSDKTFFLILDNGSALTSPKNEFTFGDKFFN